MGKSSAFKPIRSNRKLDLPVEGQRAPMCPWIIDRAVADFDIVLDVASGTRLSQRNYLHGVPWLDAHHRHRDAPPHQQEEGRSLKP